MMENEIQVGYFAFAEKKFSPDPNAYPNCQGVVAWLNPDENALIGQKGLILIPETVITIWANKLCFIDVQDSLDGCANTQKIWDYARKNDVSFPAFRNCLRYSKNGIKAGEAFVPAIEQLQKIMLNQDIIDVSLSKINGDCLNATIMSSTEASVENVWTLSPIYGLRAYLKMSSTDVRMVLAF